MPDLAAMAVTRFAGGYNCCQSVLAVLAAHQGLDAEVAIRLATGFGVGMARAGTCGAVSGAVMALGLAGGGGGPDGQGQKTATYGRVREFYSRFLERNGSIICRDLIGLDPTTPDGLARAREEQLFASICRHLVTDAVQLAQAVLAESGLPDHS